MADAVGHMVVLVVGTDLEEGHRAGLGEGHHTDLEVEHHTDLEVEHRTDLEVEHHTGLGVVLEGGIGPAEEHRTDLVEAAVRSPVGEDHRSRQELGGWSSHPWSRSCGQWHQGAT